MDENLGSIMPINVDEVIQLLCQLSDEADMKVTLKETAKGGLIAGGCTVVGGLAGGPFGMAVGGAVGGAIAAYSSWGKFQPVSSILMNMDKEKKQLLYKNTMSIMAGFNPTDLVGLTALIMGNTEIKQQLIGAVRNHVQDQLKISIID